MELITGMAISGRKLAKTLDEVLTRRPEGEQFSCGYGIRILLVAIAVADGIFADINFLLMAFPLTLIILTVSRCTGSTGSTIAY